MLGGVGTPLGAQTSCPTPEDVTTGVEVTYPDSRSVVTRDAEGSVREDEVSDDVTYTYLSDNGLIETGFSESGQDVETVFSYSFSTGDLAPPASWTARSGEQVTLEKGAEVARVPFSLHTRGEGTYRIGGCTFPAIAFQTFTRHDDGASMVEFIYLLDLGIPLATAYASDGHVEVYRPLAIAPVGVAK